MLGGVDLSLFFIRLIPSNSAESLFNFLSEKYNIQTKTRYYGSGFYYLSINEKVYERSRDNNNAVWSYNNGTECHWVLCTDENNEFLFVNDNYSKVDDRNIDRRAISFACRNSDKKIISPGYTLGGYGTSKFYLNGGPAGNVKPTIMNFTSNIKINDYNKDKNNIYFSQIICKDYGDDLKYFPINLYFSNEYLNVKEKLQYEDDT